jgi:hypothetical protein
MIVVSYSMILSRGSETLIVVSSTLFYFFEPCRSLLYKNVEVPHHTNVNASCKSSHTLFQRIFSNEGIIADENGNI